MRILLCAVGATLASLLSACGSGSTTTLPASIRVVNASSTSVTYSLNGAYAITPVASDTSSGYESIPPGTYTSSVASVNGTVASSSQTVSLGTNQNYTTIAYQRNNVVYGATIADNLAAPSATYSTLDVANVAPDAGALDVYLVASGTTSLAGLSPNFPSVPVSGLSTAATIASTNAAAAPPIGWDVWVTAAGNAGDVRLTLPAVSFASSQAYTLALTGTSGGALVNSVLIPQGLAVPAGAFQAAKQARVRVMSALPQASQVVVSVAGTPLAPDNAPNPTRYALVAGGSAISAITVTTAGVTVPITVPTVNNVLATGGDYSVLLYGDGTQAGSTAVVLTDSNQVISNYASVRVVNGAVTPAMANLGVTLYIDGTQGPNPVAYGMASTYAGFAPAASASFQLIGGTYNATPSHDLVSGSVYTVFLYDATVAPLILKDR